MLGQYPALFSFQSVLLVSVSVLVAKNHLFCVPVFLLQWLWLWLLAFGLALAESSGYGILLSVQAIEAQIYT